MKKAFVLVCALVAMSADVFAQDFAETFRQFQSQSKNSYAGTKASQQQAYFEFRDALNEKFAEQMNENWNNFEASFPQTMPERVPDVAPETKPLVLQDTPREEKKNLVSEIVPPPEVRPAIEPVIPFLDIYADDDPCGVLLESVPVFLFYGTQCRIRFAEENRFKFTFTGNEALSQMWKKLSKKNYDVVICDCLRIRKDLDLCDWAYARMVRAFSDYVFPNLPDESVFLSFYLLAQSGMKVRIAKDLDTRLHLLAGVDGIITGKPYWTFDGVAFYDIDGSRNNQMYILNLEYGNERPLTLAITSGNKFKYMKTDEREFRSEYDNLVSRCSENANSISFYNDYPNFYMDNDVYSTWKYYAQTPLSSAVKDQLYPSLREAVEGKSKLEAVNILLHFVQTSLKYEHDEDVWGGERVFFAEETLYYPSCDCEDRAILYSILVRDILGLDVVLVYYPGHLAAATELEDGTGDYYEVDGRKFFVTDPTFINGCVGDTMTCVRGYGAAIIKLTNS